MESDKEPATRTTEPTPVRVITSKPSRQIGLKLLLALLLVVIGAMLALWQPWRGQIDANARTVEVTGETTVKAEPNQFVFMPGYQFEVANEQAGVEAAAKKSKEVTAGLKKVGVADSAIKTQTSGYVNKGMPESVTDGPPSIAAYTLNYTITLEDKALAQKVQNYLATTGPQGQVSPQYGFTEAKRKELENSAREEATKDARSKAEQSARNLGFGIAGVKSVQDDNLNVGYPIMLREGTSSSDGGASTQSLQPGENEISYTVRVSFYIR